MQALSAFDQRNEHRGRRNIAAARRIEIEELREYRFHPPHHGQWIRPASEGQLQGGGSHSRKRRYRGSRPAGRIEIGYVPGPGDRRMRIASALIHGYQKQRHPLWGAFVEADRELSGGLLAGTDQLFLDAGRLTRTAAQVVQFSTAHIATTLHFDAGELRRVQLERTLHGFAGRNLTHNEGRVQAAVATVDHNAVVGLDTLE